MEIIQDKFYSMTTKERIELNNQVYSFLIPIMNKIHSSNYSERFWTIILAPYVTTINTRRPILWKKEIHTQPQIQPINSFKLPTLKEKFIVWLKYNVKAYKGRNDKIFNEKVLVGNDVIAFGFHDYESVKKDFPNFLKTCYPIIPVLRDKSKRKNVKQLAKNANSVFEKNIVNQIPQYCVEYFDFFMNSVTLHKPHNKVFNISMIETIYMRYLLAKYIENGAKLNYYQHGAFYGEYEFYSPYEWEYQISDNYYTWGWKMQEKNIPWKAYRLNRFFRNYMLQDKTKLYDCLIVFPQINKKNIITFRETTSYLINGLDKVKYKSILIRPRPSATELKYDEQFNFIHDERVVIDDGKSIIGKLIAQSKLVIQYSYPSTNLLECLYVDHPSVVILNNDQPTDIVKPYYDYFISVGVFHFDFESVVQHLNSIVVEDWWETVKSNKNYIDFKNIFLRKE